jgi:peptidoglycan/LPS O-acetylase OafA/YrhL
MAQVKRAAGAHPAGKAGSGGRLAALDSLRGIAALGVVAYHYTGGFEEVVGPHSGPVPSFVSGHFGVELFFVISGFVIAWTLERSASIYDFAVSRLARLYPAYLAAVLLAAAIVFGVGFNPQRLQGAVIGPNLIIGLPQALGRPNLDPSYWTLGLEVSFYTLAAVMSLSLVRVRTELWCLAWMGASIGLQLCLRNHVRLLLLTASGFSELFVFGAMIFKMLEAKRPSLLTVSTLVIAAAVSFVGFGEGRFAAFHPRYGVMICLFGGLVALAARDLIPPLRFKPLVAVGQASYSLYLIHQIFGYWLILRLEHVGIHPVIAIVLTSVVAIALALAMRVTIEAPGQRLIRKVLGLVKRAPVMPQAATEPAR